MKAAVMKDVSADKARPVKMIEVVDALMARAGEQFTLPTLLQRFGSTTKRLNSLLDKAVNGAFIRKGRDIAGDVVYWAPTISEREVERNRHKGDIKGYEAYLHSHWKRAESVSWERR